MFIVHVHCSLFMFIVHVHCSLFMFIVNCSHGATLIFDDLFCSLSQKVWFCIKYGGPNIWYMVGVKISLISQHSFSIRTLWGSFRLRSNLCFIKFSQFFIVFLSSVGGRTLDPLLTLALHRLFVWTSNWNQLDSHRRNQNQDGQNVSLLSPSILNP